MLCLLAEAKGLLTYDSDKGENASSETNEDQDQAAVAAIEKNACFRRH